MSLTSILGRRSSEPPKGEPLTEHQIVEQARELVATGEMEEARVLLAGWLSQGQGFWAERELAEIEFLTEQRDEALIRLGRLARDYPHTPAAATSYYVRLLGAGRTKEAGDLLAQALLNFPEDLWTLHHAALAAEAQGEHHRAFALWSRAYAIDTGHVSAEHGRLRALAAGGKHEALINALGGREVEFGEVRVDNLNYRSPDDLQITPTPMRRGLVIGSCLAAGLPDIFADFGPKCPTDFLLANHASVLPETPPQPVEAYDFQVIQIAMRSILPEGAYFALRYDQSSAYADLFQDTCDAIEDRMVELMKYNVSKGLLTFVANFLTPQQNPMGRTLPKYDLRNFAYFIAKLNEHLAGVVGKYKNSYILDIDEIASNIGRRYIQDDLLWTISHGSVLSSADFESDQARLEKISKIDDYFPIVAFDFSRIIWREIESLYRSIRQIDSVKLVLIDLDDTFWRGILAETGTTTLEGWPLGFAEALLFLKQRGIVLGIVSKNTEERILELWPYGDLVPIDIFAVRRINWLPKSDNISEILRDVNLLPGNVVYIDDNPVEREGVKRAFPSMRVIGPNPYMWRRLLLWSPETQVASITTESSQRSEMIKAQTHRETQRKSQTREEFLSSLNLHVSLRRIDSVDDREFARAIELLNKTNQFNTTGVRWSHAEVEAYFASGGGFYVLHVRDVFTTYGLVGVLCASAGRLDQFVMSCRVIGLDVEIAAVVQVLSDLRSRGLSRIHADIIETKANLLSRDIWTRTGFESQADGFEIALDQVMVLPSHITLE